MLHLSVRIYYCDSVLKHDIVVQKLDMATLWTKQHVRNLIDDVLASITLTQLTPEEVSLNMDSDGDNDMQEVKAPAKKK